ncbi:MAG: hypothetical protein Q8L21_03715, partial [Candidatus Komeilibacteria bacterium]|nr:hypothetical protein [Candidatus Komeilibacteria bacterium]
MSDRMKLMIKILIFVFLIVFFAWAIWATFFRTPGTSLVPGAATPTEQGQLPTIGTGPGGKVITEGGTSLLEPEPANPTAVVDTVASGGRTSAEPITSEPASFSTITGANFNFYNENDGRFYRISKNGGEPVLLSSDVFNNVSNVNWAANSDKAVLEFPDGSNIFYDFTTKERATLPKAARDFSFSTSGEALGYKYVGQSPDDRWLVTSSPNGENQKLIEPLADEFNNVAVNWSPNNQIVATFRESTGSGEEVFFLGQNNENFLSLQTNGLGFEGKWSPSGNQILYSVYNANTDYKPVLYAAGMQLDAIGDGNRSLRLATWPDKCAFAGETLLYCAVPKSLETGSGLYPELANTVSDVIYKVDLENNL